MSMVDLDREAVLGSVEVVRAAPAAALGNPTPCAGWDLRQLLAHMSAQHRGFAAAAAGRGSDPLAWVERETGDPVGEYLAAAQEVLAAFADPGVPDRDFALPLIHPTIEFPAEQAISFHFVDYVVHGWDVARSIGAAFEPAPQVAAAALRVAQAVPDGAPREAPGAAFAPVLPAESGSTIDQVLALLGRSPAWPD